MKGSFVLEIKTIITADSTCDLPVDFCEKYNITKFGLWVDYNNKVVTDDGTIDNWDIYKYTNDTGKLPKSAARSVPDYVDFFKSFTDKGYQVVHISISSELSASYQNALLASSELENVCVVDSRLLSSGQGILAIRCAEKAAEGMSASDIKAFADEYKSKISTSFVVDTLDNLAKGGRCSALAAFGANVLKIKPSIVMPDGKLIVGKKYRGKLEGCFEQYIKDTLTPDKEYELDRIFITHSGLDDPEIAERLKALVLSIVPFKEVVINVAGICVAAHCGPNTLGILFSVK